MLNGIFKGSNKPGHAQNGLLWGLDLNSSTGIGVLHIRSFPPKSEEGNLHDGSYFIVKSRRESIPKLIIFYDTRWFGISTFGATFTANLAAFLKINKYEHPIKNIRTR